MGREFLSAVGDPATAAVTGDPATAAGVYGLGGVLAAALAAGLVRALDPEFLPVVGAAVRGGSGAGAGIGAGAGGESGGAGNGTAAGAGNGGSGPPEGRRGAVGPSAAGLGAVVLAGGILGAAFPVAFGTALGLPRWLVSRGPWTLATGVGYGLLLAVAADLALGAGALDLPGSLRRRRAAVAGVALAWGLALGYWAGLVDPVLSAMTDPLPLVPYTLASLAAVPLSLGVAYYAWTRRERTAAGPLVAAMVGGGVWALFPTLQYLASTKGAALFFVKAKYVGITLLVLGWFAFAAEYTGRGEWITRRTVALLLVEPVLVQLAVWTNGVHGLFWSAVPPAAPDAGVAEIGPVAHGPLFWVHSVYSYVLLAAGMAMLLGTLYRSKSLYRGQAAAVLAAVVVPLSANALFLGGLTADDFTPVGYAVSGVALLVAITRYEFVDLAPVARATVVDSVADGVVVLDRAGRVVDVNPAACRIFGVDGDPPVGAPVEELLGDYPGLVERLDDRERGREEIAVEDGGDLRYFEVDLAPLFDDRDRRVGRIVVVHDVTERKRREQELRRQNEQLDRFASLVSHDLRNPLNVADGYLQLAEGTGDVDHLREVSRSHERMRRLIDDVLALARQGQSVGETGPVALGDLARRAWGNVDTGAATLEVLTDATVQADETRLLRAFENLFRNAVEHGTDDDRGAGDGADDADDGGAGDGTDEGAGTGAGGADDAGAGPGPGPGAEAGTPAGASARGADLTVRVGWIGNEDDLTLLHPEERGFYVEDTGPGIPEAERDRVLEDGFTTAEDGTGLGLSIVTSIVEAHGWSIAVSESAEGGARFEVTGVPATDPEAAPVPARAD